MRTDPARLLRLLVVLPSWLGDGAMATPALRLLRDRLPGSYIAGLARPAVADLLQGSPLLDEILIERASGMMGRKHAAARVRALRFDAALLLTNSFSTALVARLAGIPCRVGYDRDGRGMLLTRRLRAPEWPGSTAVHRRWAPVSAVAYYYAAAMATVGDQAPDFTTLQDPLSILPEGTRLELPLSVEDRAGADEVLGRAGIGARDTLAVLNPGANDPAKRWAPERFGALARWLADRYRLRVAVNSGPGEEEIAEAVRRCAPAVVLLGEHGQTLGSLKAVLARSHLLVTNDTGPRHLAAAVGTPTIALFGPTDPRWTTLPERAGTRREILVVAGTPDPGAMTDEHPERYRMELIGLESVQSAAEVLLGAGEGARPQEPRPGQTPVREAPPGPESERGPGPGQA
ncbi:MAG: glycosyltransferase family 9 protein [Phycisphaerales bacterium]|nr:glycosyltransferase family 9 protein [Phycisphaerales bacterium]